MGNLVFLGHPRFAPTRRAWAPRRAVLAQTQTQPASTNSRQWGVHLGITMGALLTGLLIWPYRNTPLGAVGVGAAGSTAGVGLAFLIMDLMGAGPGGR
jgi:hypothetical protein